MRKLLLFLLTALACRQAISQDQSGPIALIPEPVSQQVTAGQFILPNSISIEASSQQDLAQTLQDLKTHLGTPTGYAVTVSQQTDPAATIRLVINKAPDKTLGAEGYTLTVTPKSVLIRANQPAGIFYGIQTFYQLLPKEIESPALVKMSSWQAPCDFAHKPIAVSRPTGKQSQA